MPAACSDVRGGAQAAPVIEAAGPEPTSKTPETGGNIGTGAAYVSRLLTRCILLFHGDLFQRCPVMDSSDHDPVD